MRTNSRGFERKEGRRERRKKGEGKLREKEKKNKRVGKNWAENHKDDRN